VGIVSTTPSGGFLVRNSSRCPSAPSDSSIVGELDSGAGGGGGLVLVMVTVSQN
jgi:hypothetical protein